MVPSSSGVPIGPLRLASRNQHARQSRTSQACPGPHAVFRLHRPVALTCARSGERQPKDRGGTLDAGSTRIARLGKIRPPVPDRRGRWQDDTCWHTGARRGVSGCAGGYPVACRSPTISFSSRAYRLNVLSESCWILKAGAKRIALADIAAIQPAFEPLHTLG